MSSSDKFTPKEGTTLHRKPERGSYDRAQAYAILDEALFCSVGFTVAGAPYVLPMAFARLDDHIVLHGAPASRLGKSLASGARICVTVTILDGLVLARSAFHHSMNYRSVVVLGSALEIDDPQRRRQALLRVVDHVLPGRSRVAREPTDKELAATRVLALPIEEASVKIRSGDPIDDQEDAAFDCWAGCVPLALVAGPPIQGAQFPTTQNVPPEILNYRRVPSQAAPP
jgi:nitroimidazol reductase NimA-like FMN-containing flavoprotein (pyridoxamine 5'-phosphate oxidase superfamily)